jgi:hypothetical protein
MIFVDLTNAFYQDLDKHILSINEIEKYIFDLINYLEIEDYVLGVDFIDNTENLGTYSFENLMIKLNIPNIISEAKKIYNDDSINENEILFINLNILQAVLHEIVHGIQNYHLNESNFPYNILYAKELAYKDIISDELYNKYYYLFSYERDAIITSLENVLHIIKKYHKDKEKTFTYFLNDLYRFMVLGYTVNIYNIQSPAEKLYSGIYHEETPTLSNIDTYDRMKLGYQMGYRKFKKFKRNKIRKILVKNNLL